MQSTDQSEATQPRIMSSTAVGVLGSRQSGTRNQEATIYVGNLDEKATEALLHELFLQVGPVVYVHIPRDRISQIHQGYGFVEFQTEDDADYAIKVMNGIKFFGKPIKLNKSSQDKKSLDVGANLFVGNLAPEVDEKMLFDTFILFGTLIQTPKVARDEATGVSRGYGFVSYDSFEASDAAIEGMNGQFLANRPVTVNYAFKKDGKGERHGSAAERLLAANNKKLAAATAPPSAVTPAAPIPLQTSPGMPSMPMAPMPMAAPMMAYPSNVPASMYYSSAFPAYPMTVPPYPPMPMQSMPSVPIPTAHMYPPPNSAMAMAYPPQYPPVQYPAGYPPPQPQQYPPYPQQQYPPYPPGNNNQTR